ncbi:hypothetical protein ACFL5O_01495 [Myxococcota bacterium]
MDPRQRELRQLVRAAQRAALRLRLNETVARSARLLPWPLLYATAGLTYLKIGRPPETAQTWLWWGWLLPWLVVLLGTVHCWWRRRPREMGALALDRHHGFQDRVTNALAFLALPEGQRTVFMKLAVADAQAHAAQLKPRRAAPMCWPQELWLVGFLLAGLGGLAVLEVRTLRWLPVPPAPAPVLLAHDDIELFRKLSQRMQDQSQDPETLAGVHKLNQLLEDLAERRLDRAEVFRRLAELERQVQSRSKEDQASLAEALQSVARELEHSGLSRRVARALQQRRLDDAEKALRELAEKLKKQRTRPSAAELEKLRQSLKKASQATQGRSKRLEAERRRLAEQRKSLLRKKREGRLTPHEEQVLRDTERRLDRLDRKKRTADRTREHLSDLDRKLGQAAEDLRRELGQAAADLESAAEDLNRLARNPMSQEEKEELLRRLRELKELLRQQGQGGNKRLQRLQRFAERARGRSGQSGQRGQERGRGKNRDELWQSGKGQGDRALVLGGGTSEQLGREPSGQREKPKSPGSPSDAREPGTGHNEDLRGDRSELGGKAHDVTAAGIDTGDGTASSQVIMGAAQRGFAGHGYRQVFQDYQTVAEEVMGQEKIPPGYRFYVQRYFQLIRPRE